MSRDMTKPTKWVCAQRRLRSAWTSAQSSPSAWRTVSLATHWAHSEDADQIGWMPRLIWVFAGRTATLLVLSCRGSIILYILHSLYYACRLISFCVSFQINKRFVDETFEERSNLPVHGRDSGYLCPFSHPSYLQLNNTVANVGPPAIPNLSKAFPLRPKRAVQFKTRYVDHSGNVLSYASGHLQIRVDATVHVSDYALQLVSATTRQDVHR